MGKSVDEILAELINHATEQGLSDVTVFVASIPDSKSAIQVGGDDATLKLDIARTAPLLGERLHNQRPAIWTLDAWQNAKRPIAIIAILYPSVQAEMEFGAAAEEKSPEPAAPADENVKTDAPVDGVDPEWPSTMSPVVHNHLHVTLADRDELQQLVGRELLQIGEGSGA